MKAVVFNLVCVPESSVELLKIQMPGKEDRLVVAKREGACVGKFESWGLADANYYIVNG